MEAMTHCLYANAVAKHSLWRQQPLAAFFTPMQIGMTGFWVLLFMWLKVNLSAVIPFRVGQGIQCTRRGADGWSLLIVAPSTAAPCCTADELFCCVPAVLVVDAELQVSRALCTSKHEYKGELSMQNKHHTA